MSAKGITFHAFAFSGLFNSDILKDVIRKIMSIVKAVPVYGRRMQTVRGAVSITR